MSLTDEDKQWIAAQLQGVHGALQDVRVALAQLQDVRAAIAQLQELPAAIAQLRDLPAAIAQLQDLPAAIAQLQDLPAAIQEVRAHVEETETKLLRAFHDWASPVEMRARSHSAALRAMDIEIESLSDRVSKLERPQ